jgi:hypothetical protein
MNANKSHIDTYITDYLISHNQEIIDIRKKYKIPISGYDWEEFLLMQSYPDKWYYKDKYKEIEKIKINLKHKFSDFLYLHEWSIFLYLLFNNLEPLIRNEKYEFVKINDHVESIELEIEFTKKHPYISKDTILASFIQQAKDFPIAIFITPEVGKTNLKRFIDNNWEAIEKLRNKYSNPFKEKQLKMNKKSRGFQSNLRRMFIFQNKNENSKTLRMMLYEKFNYRVSEEQIRTEKSKILQLLKKK